MTLYILKSILCSAVLIGAYYLFLERGKIHTFKRWYLLCSLLLSLIIPFVTIEIEQKIVHTISQVEEYVPIDIPFIAEHSESQVAGTLAVAGHSDNTSPDFNWATAILIIYGMITAGLLFRLCNNFLSILWDVNDKPTRLYLNATFVFHNKYTIPYSFLNYIFIQEEDYRNRQILLHELTHVRQKHSLDILLIEFIHCLMWFNPALIFYKRAIRLNHEFLADEVVLKNFPTVEYQNILFKKAQLTSARSLASSFNYLTTKKRFIMMTTMKNQTQAFIRIALSCILLVCAVLVFPKKLCAQDTSVVQNVPAKVIAKQNGDGATIEMVTEFDSIIYKYMRSKESEKGKVTMWFYTTGITDTERTKMREIYNMMTAEQKAKYPANSKMIFAPFTPPKKNPPTAQEFATYADPTIYGVWLDGKRIANAELKNYQPADITHVFKNRLLKNAAHYGQYKFHLDLMTQAYFEKIYPPKFK